MQKKESKLLQKLTKSEEGRNFLKKAIGILEDRIANFEAENTKLKEGMYALQCNFIICLYVNAMRVVDGN